MNVFSNPFLTKVTCVMYLVLPCTSNYACSCCVTFIAISLSQDKAPVESSPFGTLPPKAPGHDASGDDNPFGTRKARSSFGRGFFKIKSNKRTASAPNLGMCGQNAISLILPESGKDQSLPLFIYLYISFSQK